VGRSTLYGVAAGGQAGAARALEIFRDEIHRNIALLGVSQLKQLGPQYLKFLDSTLRAPQSLMDQSAAESQK
jgi:isopentenyl diphosphate isomerase/L-lactate dehydrogenase-like FMN-dependent dehydrogenase